MNALEPHLDMLVPYMGAHCFRYALSTQDSAFIFSTGKLLPHMRQIEPRTLLCHFLKLCHFAADMDQLIANIDKMKPHLQIIIENVDALAPRMTPLFDSIRQAKTYRRHKGVATTHGCPTC